ncbi:MAG: PfkB family carbohydrate kinase [Allorhizobium sp.]
MTSTIVVMGGAHIERRGSLDGETVIGASNVGRWREVPGGSGFNAACALARLGHPVKLIAPRGGDIAGEAVGSAAQEAGVDDRPFTFLDRATASDTVILDRDGNLVMTVADLELYRLFGARRLKIRAVRQALDAASLVLCDANLPAETLDAIADAAIHRSLPMAGIAGSAALVRRFRSCLDRIDIMFVNSAAAAELCEEIAQEPEYWPAMLRVAGLKCGVVTCGPGAVIAFDADAAYTLQPPAHCAMTDGGQDALAAGMLSARLAGLALGEALRHGMAVAAITRRSPHPAAIDLSPAPLKSQLALVPQAKILS